MAVVGEKWIEERLSIKKYVDFLSKATSGARNKDEKVRLIADVAANRKDILPSLFVLAKPVDDLVSLWVAVIIVIAETYGYQINDEAALLVLFKLEREAKMMPQITHHSWRDEFSNSYHARDTLKKIWIAPSSSEHSSILDEEIISYLSQTTKNLARYSSNFFEAFKSTQNPSELPTFDKITWPYGGIEKLVSRLKKVARITVLPESPVLEQQVNDLGNNTDAVINIDIRLHTRDIMGKLLSYLKERIAKKYALRTYEDIGNYYTRLIGDIYRTVGFLYERDRVWFFYTFTSIVWNLLDLPVYKAALYSNDADKPSYTSYGGSYTYIKSITNSIGEIVVKRINHTMDFTEILSLAVAEYAQWTPKEGLVNHEESIPEFIGKLAGFPQQPDEFVKKLPALKSEPKLDSSAEPPEKKEKETSPQSSTVAQQATNTNASAKIICQCGATSAESAIFCYICGKHIDEELELAIQEPLSEVLQQVYIAWYEISKSWTLSELSQEQTYLKITLQEKNLSFGIVYQSFIERRASKFGCTVDSPTALSFLYTFLKEAWEMLDWKYPFSQGLCKDMMDSISEQKFISLIEEEIKYSNSFDDKRHARHALRKEILIIVGSIIFESVHLVRFSEVIVWATVECFKRMSKTNKLSPSPQEIRDFLKQWVILNNRRKLDKAPKTPEKEEKEVNAPPPPNQSKDPMPDQPDNPIPKDSPIPQVNAYRQAMEEVEREGESFERAKKEFEPIKEAYEQARETFQQEREKFEQIAEKKLGQPRKDLENFIAVTSDIATLYHIWQFNIDNNKAVRTQLKELYKDKIPADATPFFQVITQKKSNATYQYLQIRWSRTVDTDPDGEPIKEGGEIHLGTLSKFVLTNPSREPSI